MTTIQTDEVSFQVNFYSQIFPNGLDDVVIAKSTDGYTNNIINVKININEHNVYGWANFYYENATNFKQKPEKKAFFDELRNPKGTLKNYINAWQGQEIDFKYIMDMLNDPMTQKKLGAFYTPSEYAKLGVELVRRAIDRAMKPRERVKKPIM